MVNLAAIQSDASNGQVNSSNLTSAINSYTPANLPSSATQMSADYAGKSTGFNFPADIPKYYMRMELATYNRNWGQVINGIGAPGGKAGGINFPAAPEILLPLPLQLQNQLPARWNKKPMLSMATNAIGAAAGALVGGGNGGAAGQAGNVIGQVLGAGLEVAGADLGLAINKFVVITYEGPEYKHHSFSWKLVPRNPSESEAIRQIVKMLMNAASPTTITNSGGAVWGYPKIVRCSYMPNSKYLYKFKPAVLTSVTANYSGGGQPAFLRQDIDTPDEYKTAINAPEGVILQVQMMELEYWLRGDHNDSNKPEDVYTPDNDDRLDAVPAAIRAAMDKAANWFGDQKNPPVAGFVPAPVPPKAP